MVLYPSRSWNQVISSHLPGSLTKSHLGKQIAWARKSRWSVECVKCTNTLGSCTFEAAWLPLNCLGSFLRAAAAAGYGYCFDFCPSRRKGIFTASSILSLWENFSTVFVIEIWRINVGTGHDASKSGIPQSNLWGEWEGALSPNDIIHYICMQSIISGISLHHEYLNLSGEGGLWVPIRLPLLSLRGRCGRASFWPDFNLLLW